jgi:hypothetical protein
MKIINHLYREKESIEWKKRNEMKRYETIWNESSRVGMNWVNYRLYQFNIKYLLLTKYWNDHSIVIIFYYLKIFNSTFYFN